MNHLARSYQARARTASTMITRVAAVGVWTLVAAFILLLIFKMVMFIAAPYREAYDFLHSVY